MIRIAARALAVVAVLFVGTVPGESGPPLLTDTYVFKGGEGYPGVLVVETLSGLATPALNPNTLADGVVEPPDSKCNARHYVGSLHGADTPVNENGKQKDAGWGKLSLVPVGLNPLNSYATAWTSAETAHRVLIGLRDLGGATYADAGQEIAAAIVALELLSNQLKQLKTDGAITGDERQAIEKQLDAAKERLILAGAGLLKLGTTPAIESNPGTLGYFVIVRQLVLAKSALGKMLQKMENAGLLPSAN